MIVYHDAFQYFERSFGLKSVGAILLKADQTPSIKHIKILKKLAKKKKVTCVLGIPGAHPKIATVVMSGTNAGYGVVDPLGLYLDKGPELYFDVILTWTRRHKEKAISWATSPSWTNRDCPKIPFQDHSGKFDPFAVE